MVTVEREICRLLVNSNVQICYLDKAIEYLSHVILLLILLEKNIHMSLSYVRTMLVGV